MQEIINKKYLLDEFIGSGGMANVYKAKNVLSGEVVAIKILKDEFSHDKELLRRFHREAKATLHLKHENIVHAYDVGEYNDLPYIVFEYVEGHTIKELIEEKGKLSIEEATVLCSQILDALDEAHSIGIIHRDIKPQNVMVSLDGIAKLADFGIARDVSASTITFEGKNILGSVHYISPEQARGDAVTIQSDIYSMGITLYEMLTGDVPFHGETAVATAIMQINDEPLPPRDIDPSISESLNKIVLKAIQKDPEKRYKTAKEMQSDLILSLSNPIGSFITFSQDSIENTEQAPAIQKFKLLAFIAGAVLLPICFLLTLNALNRKSATINLPDQNDTDHTPSDNVQEIVYPVENSIVTSENNTRMRLEDGLIQYSDLSPIFVRYMYDETGANIGFITDISKQDNGLFLTVGSGMQGRYKADVSFTVDIPENDTDVMFVYKTAGESGTEYYVILQEYIVVKENNVTLSASVTSKDEASRMVYLLLNGQEIRSQNVKFVDN